MLSLARERGGGHARAGAMLAAALALAWGVQAAAQTDVHAMFDQAERDGRVGLARKTEPVDVRAAQPGEVVVTVIAGEGKERKVRRRSRATWWCATAARRPATRRSWSAPPSSPSATRAARAADAPAGSRTARAASRWPISSCAPPMARSPSPRPGASRWWRALATRSCAIRATRRTPIGSPPPRSRAPTSSAAGAGAGIAGPWDRRGSTRCSRPGSCRARTSGSASRTAGRSRPAGRFCDDVLAGAAAGDLGATADGRDAARAASGGVRSIV